MKTFFQILSSAAALALAPFAGQAALAQDDTQTYNSSTPAGTSNPQDNSGVSFQTFYDQLANQGTWVQTDKYGYVFQPTETDPNWRPYTYGHWVNTDAGMTWVSDESFGWATYHYGRWVNLDDYGWVWVPGYTWAPAWVSWRDGDDEVGWAPLPPDSDVGIDFYGDDFGFDLGFHIGDDCDLAYGIGPGWYNFCPVVFIGDPDCWRHFRDRRDNFGLIDRTRNVTNINFRRDGAGQFGRVHAEGPSVAALNARARTPIETAQLTSASRVSGAGLHGNSLAVFAPRIDPDTVKTARPDVVSRTLANTSVNRGTDINRPLAVNSGIRPAGATANQIHAATVAQTNVPANARIATANTHVSRPLTQPLTSLRTNPEGTSTFRTGLNRNTAAGTAPSRSLESSYTGGTWAERPTVSSSVESRYTGEPAARSWTTPSGDESRYTGEAVTPARATSTFHSFPSYSQGESYRSPSVFHESGSSMYHPQPSFQSSMPLFRSSAPVYHPQSNFRSFAPTSQPHFNGGNFSGGAPAAHFSGGSFGGGGRSYGGGSAQASGSAGGGHSSGGSGRR